MRNSELENRIIELGPWFHNITFEGGVQTREVSPSPGPQPASHPLSRWQALEPHLPGDMTGLNVLDIGSADGYFAIEFAKRGAKVLAVDSSIKMIQRAKFAATELGLPMDALVCDAETLHIEQGFDIIFNLGLLYHSKHPLLLLENLWKVTHDVMYLESAVAEGDEPYLYFKPPQEGVSHIRKWFPTQICIEEMLKFVGYRNIETFEYKTPNRVFLRAQKPQIKR